MSDRYEHILVNNEEEWQEFRAKCLEVARTIEQRLIEQWCKESNVKTPVGYYRDCVKHVFTVYTNRPGELIGKGGKNIEKFKADLLEEYKHEYDVKIVEVRGGFANLCPRT